MYFSTQNVYLHQSSWLILRTSVIPLKLYSHHITNCLEDFPKRRKTQFSSIDHFHTKCILLANKPCMSLFPPVAQKSNILSCWMFIPCSVRTCLGTCTTELIVASSAFTSTNVAFAFFLCLLYSWKWHCYCTKKNHFNSFKKRVKTLAFICKALYLGLCCLHVLYRWFHFYIRPHFSPPNGKLGFRFCSDIEFIELSFEASAPLDSPVTVQNVFKRFIYLLCVRQMSPHHHCGPTYSTSPHSSEHFS